MAKVKKQTTTKKRTKRKTGGVKDKIRPVGESRYGLKMVLYGKTKSGKTTLAADFPKPLMLIGTMDTLEDGTLSISDVEGVDFFPLEKTEELGQVLDLIVEEGYQSVVLDTGGGLHATVMKEYLELDEIPVQRNWGMATRQQWGVIAAQTKEYFKKILNLSMTHGINSVIIAHEKTFTSADDDESNDLDISPSMGPALSDSVAAWLNGASDYICQTFIRKKFVTKKRRNRKGKEIETKVPTEGTEYCLRIGPHEVYMTGFRKPKSKKIPDVIVDPTFKKIEEIIH